MISNNCSCDQLGQYSEDEYNIFIKVLCRSVLLYTCDNKEANSYQKTGIRTAIESLGAGFCHLNKEGVTKGKPVGLFQKQENILTMLDKGRGMEKHVICKNCGRGKATNLQKQIKENEKNRENGCSKTGRLYRYEEGEESDGYEDAKENGGNPLSEKYSSHNRPILYEFSQRNQDYRYPSPRILRSSHPDQHSYDYQSRDWEHRHEYRDREDRDKEDRDKEDRDRRDRDRRDRDRDRDREDREERHRDREDRHRGDRDREDRDERHRDREHRHRGDRDSEDRDSEDRDSEDQDSEDQDREDQDREDRGKIKNLQKEIEENKRKKRKRDSTCEENNEVEKIKRSGIFSVSWKSKDRSSSEIDENDDVLDVGDTYDFRTNNSLLNQVLLRSPTVKEREEERLKMTSSHDEGMFILIFDGGFQTFLRSCFSSKITNQEIDPITSVSSISAASMRTDKETFGVIFVFELEMKFNFKKRSPIDKGVNEMEDCLVLLELLLDECPTFFNVSIDLDTLKAENIRSCLESIEEYPTDVDHIKNVLVKEINNRHDFNKLVKCVFSSSRNCEVLPLTMNLEFTKLAKIFAASYQTIRKNWRNKKKEDGTNVEEREMKRRKMNLSHDKELNSEEKSGKQMKNDDGRIKKSVENHTCHQDITKNSSISIEHTGGKQQDGPFARRHLNDLIRVRNECERRKQQEMEINEHDKF